MFATLSLILLTLLSPRSPDWKKAHQEVYYFDVYARGKVVGELKCSRVEEANAVTYTNRANIETKFLKTFHVFYEYENIYRKDKLIEANVISKLNGNTRNWTRLKRQGYHEYLFYDRLKEENHTITEEIGSSVVKLHYHEPVGVHKVFSEQNGVFHEIHAIGPHTYQKINGNRKDIFTYENGHLVKSEIDGGLLTLTLLAKDH